MTRRRRPDGAIAYRPVAFWLGVAAVTAGVCLHLPMFLSAGAMHYRLAGMHTDSEMVIGMALIAAGVLATAYALVPRRSVRSGGAPAPIRIRTLDDAPLRRAQVALLFVMALAVTIDVMKPVTLGFVVPGMAKEYGLNWPVNPAAAIHVAVTRLAVQRRGRVRTLS